MFKECLQTLFSFMRIISFDPGYGRLGIAILEKTSQKEVLIFSECFETPKETQHSQRLAQLGARVNELLFQFKPTHAAIEGLFFSKNTTTALKVAEVRGILIFLCESNNINIHEFTPNEIKVAVTGYGKSDKKSVQTMTTKLINLPDRKMLDDEIDAIACGLTFFAHKNTLLRNIK